ncbi:MAG: hypothetical protein HKN21_01105, partial [Candidatus Eisenbacteria bacterium]|nr:hypothetical protein [Candidatus Eisenbacteria bacterium]
MRLLCVSLSLTLCLLLSCSSSSTSPDKADGWTFVDFPRFSGGIFDVTFQGDRGVAIGVQPGSGGGQIPAVLEYSDDRWVVSNTPELNELILVSVGITPTGETLLAGLNPSTEHSVLVDPRANPTVQEIQSDAAFFGLHFGSVNYAYGVGNGGLLFREQAPGDWVSEAFPAVSSAEVGIRDMVESQGTVYACGWDDGGPPYRFVMQNGGQGWSPMDVPTDSQINRQFTTLAAGSNLLLYVGGLAYSPNDETNPEVHGPFLLQHTAGNGWTALVLPAREDIGTINDLVLVGNTLIAATGAGNGKAGVLIANGSGVTHEVLS